MQSLTKTSTPKSSATPRVDLDPASPEFARRTIGWFKAIYSRTARDERDLADALADLRTFGIEKIYPPDQPYGDLDKLLRAEIGKGLGELERQISTTASERIVAAVNETTGDVLEKGKVNQYSVVAQIAQPKRAHASGISRRSQQKLDALARMADRTLFDAVKARRLSLNAAAIRAGFAKPTATVRTDDIDAVAAFLVKHFDRDDIRKIADLALFQLE